jgi:hypothetical protein
MSKRQNAKWTYGIDSDYELHIATGSTWLPTMYSLDVRTIWRTKSSATVYTQTRILENLKKLMARGKLGKVSWQPYAVTFAYICPAGHTNVADRLRNALCIYKNGAWSDPKTIVETKGYFNLWVAHAQSAKTVPLGSNDLVQFAEGDNAPNPQLLAKYADVLPLFLEAYAHGKKAKMMMPAPSRAFLYSSVTRNVVARIDVRNGTICGCGMGEGGAWIAPHLLTSH